MGSDDKNWASKYLLDPLNEPEPSDVTGPGTHFRSTVAPVTSNDDKKQASSKVSEVGTYPSPPQSASPSRSRFRNGKAKEETDPFRTSSEVPTSTARNSVVTSSGGQQDTGRRRGSSLHERYPGDESNRPLDVIRKSSLRAQRSPHLRKSHHHGVDSIDKLAGIEGAHHIGGPFDVVSTARNVSSRDSPVAALRSSNAEALRATPREAIIDSLRHRRPLDGVAAFPPGVPDRTGRVLHYQEGSNIQRGEGENVLGQWPAYYTYHPDDIKGKAEPSFTIERSLKEHDRHKRAVSEGIELTSRPKQSLGDNNPFSPRTRAVSGAATSGADQSYGEWERGLHPGSSGKGGVARKIGSLRRRNRNEGQE